MTLAYRCSNCGTELQTSNSEGLKEFVDLVKQVREAQKKYFKTRADAKEYIRNDLSQWAPNGALVLGRN